MGLPRSPAASQKNLMLAARLFTVKFVPDASPEGVEDAHGSMQKA